MLEAMYRMMTLLSRMTGLESWPCFCLPTFCMHVDHAYWRRVPAVK